MKAKINNKYCMTRMGDISYTKRLSNIVAIIKDMRDGTKQS